VLMKPDILHDSAASDIPARVVLRGSRFAFRWLAGELEMAWNAQTFARKCCR
jgi:hypothetical protein